LRLRDHCAFVRIHRALGASGKQEYMVNIFLFSYLYCKRNVGMPHIQLSNVAVLAHAVVPSQDAHRA
jgi:hypothetical protein